MKRSQIALLSVSGILAGIVIASVVSARIAISSDNSAIAEEAQVSGYAELRGFSGIDVGGQWQVQLSQGDDWQVELSYPERLADRVKVYLRGDRLRLRLDTRAWWKESDFSPTADIVMPELEELDLRGASQVDMRGFRGSRLEVDIVGAARLEGRDGRYDELELSVAGASHIDLRGVTVTDADVDLAGASKITLTMNGGALSGSMVGAGSLEYYGAVSEESIRLVGASFVERAQ